MAGFQLNFIVFFVASMTIIQLSTAGGEGSVSIQNCSGACAYRCSATHHRGNCIDTCNDCCGKCLCVPSGTYGNKDECPCYRDMRTQEGQPKCP
ncbi:peamaclein-like [Bidens hawaiensis]|uniref:peamaclein-like n=1 Tax=Bidens hawaiensis TaxID=980011 RepID=UPI00404A84E2